MTSDQKAAFVNAQTACMLVEMESMKVANAIRALLGDVPRHGESDFLDLPVKYGVTHNALVGFLDG